MAIEEMLHVQLLHAARTYEHEKSKKAYLHTRFVQK